MLTFGAEAVVAPKEERNTDQCVNRSQYFVFLLRSLSFILLFFAALLIAEFRFNASLLPVFLLEQLSLEIVIDIVFIVTLFLLLPKFRNIVCELSQFFNLVLRHFTTLFFDRLQENIIISFGIFSFSRCHMLRFILFFSIFNQLFFFLVLRELHVPFTLNQKWEAAVFGVL